LRYVSKYCSKNENDDKNNVEMIGRAWGEINKKNKNLKMVEYYYNVSDCLLVKINRVMRNYIKSREKTMGKKYNKKRKIAATTFIPASEINRLLDYYGDSDDNPMFGGLSLDELRQLKNDDKIDITDYELENVNCWRKL